ncbi:hypothetical protein KYI11_09335 [Macrococcoides bohemicum]|uniref:Uncharacterized protein n=1 Tax=Macrococcoides bohemicum TaxID=1903056 RepID=A0AAJ4TVW1_9STAP|nr:MULTISPECIES: hypothetical protein [Macrococcus]ATD29898.1 hypothetical protein BHM04_01385 [Macrococcus sp. IME1552]QYA41831.1 hypothetical protein KYI11_09335 [Macrococcus bohemicus]
MTMNNQISLYRKISAGLKKEVAITASKPELYYYIDEKKEIIDLEKCETNIITVNEYDDKWTPSENELFINIKFNIENPSALFGEKGVTLKNNTLAMAVHLHSKSSFFQKTISFADIQFSEEKQEFIYTHKFNKEQLRGNINLDFYIYAKEIKEKFPIHAQNQGMSVTVDNLFSYLIVIDGEGSVFPITEFEEKNGPLWKVNKNWTDAAFESFNINYVSLALNTAHPMFKFIKEEKTNLSRYYMSDIIGQSMAMIINEVVNVEKYEISESVENSHDSIYSVVSYWVKTFEINTSDIFTISESILRKLNARVGGVEQ